MDLLQKFSFLILLFCFTNVYSHEFIPVYMWDTSKSSNLLPSLGSINDEFFRDILLDKINKDTITLVFLEENLSPEDFTTYHRNGANVFQYLSHLQSTSKVNYYPFVENPLESLHKLQGIKVTTVNVTENGLPKNTDVKPGQVLVIDLNDAKENENRIQMLKRHDTLIKQIFESASENGKIVALFTARHSSWLVPSVLEENAGNRKARHLLAVDDKDDKKEDYFFVNASNLLIYAKPEISFHDGTNSANFSGHHTISTDNLSHVIITINDYSLIFNFSTSNGYWYLHNIQVQLPNKTIAFNEKLRDVYATNGFSYHCHNTVFTSKGKTLSLPSFQVELFKSNTSSKGFDDSYDCVGFTTAPIWSGLFVTFILALIMTFGLGMIMDIRTMDRFDDPKGKTISINVSE